MEFPIIGEEKTFLGDPFIHSWGEIMLTTDYSKIASRYDNNNLRLDIPKDDNIGRLSRRGDLGFGFSISHVGRAITLENRSRHIAIFLSSGSDSTSAPRCSARL